MHSICNNASVYNMFFHYVDHYQLNICSCREAEEHTEDCFQNALDYALERACRVFNLTEDAIMNIIADY